MLKGVIFFVGAASVFSSPTPCQPRCLCNTTSYRCVGANLTALPVDMFRGWHALEAIDVSFNLLQSPLPPTLFSNLPALASLLLAGCNVTALPQHLLDGLSALKTLSLAGNPIAALPAGVFSRLPSLAALDLSALALVVPIDISTLGALPALTSLNLRRSSSSGSCPVFSSLAQSSPRFKSLVVSGMLTSIPPYAFSGLNLTTLDLSGSNLPTLRNYTLAGLTVSTVSLESSSIVELEAAAFYNLTAGFLDLNQNSIGTGGVPPGGISIPGVSQLGLSCGAFDSGVFAKPLFADARRLTSLDLQGDTIGGQSSQLGALPARAFASAPLLQSLNLNDCSVTGFDLAAFEGVPNLQTLYLGWNQINALPPGLFDPLPQLTTLAARYNGLSYLNTSLFARNHLLESFDVSGNGILSLPDSFFAERDQLSNIDLTYQQWLVLAPGTFVGINASGTLLRPVSIGTFGNHLSSYDNLTDVPSITSAICAEARASAAACTVYW